MPKTRGQAFFNLVDACQFQIYPCHMGEAQGPRLMQRKVAPSWASVKTLINTRVHSFHKEQQDTMMRLHRALHLYFATYSSFTSSVECPPELLTMCLKVVPMLLCGFT